MNPNQQTSEVRHEDDAALSEFLASLMDYTPTIPDELVEHYLSRSGFQCPDVRLIRLVAIATQKFVSDVATEALQQCKARQSTVVKDKRDKQQKILIQHFRSQNFMGVNLSVLVMLACASTGMDPATGMNEYVIQNPNCDWDEIPSLPMSAYALLSSKFKPCTSVVHSVFNSSDQVTTKLLIQLQNGEFVEAVIMRYDSRLGMYGGNPRPGGVRSTLCVSSQVGCKMGCTFCATGSMGFKNNLSSGEILEQLVHASRFAEIRNVVFMGMGEPLNNYSAIVEAIQSMIIRPFQLSFKRITVSTVGIIHAIKKFHNDLPNVNLAVSLHAPVQEVRCKIMPAARAFPLGKLMDTLQEYQKISLQKIFIEYIMLDGVNDQEEHAHQLGKLLETFEVVVNLIPFNPIGILSEFQTSRDEKVTKFQKILRGTYNIRTTIRKQMGQDISGACGQLVVSKSDGNSEGGRRVVSDIEDLHL